MLFFGVPGVPESGQFGVMLGLSWHLKGILRRLKIVLSIKIDWERGGGDLAPPSEGPETPHGEGI